MPKNNRENDLLLRAWRVCFIIMALAIGFIGVQIFIYLALPLPWMLGAMFAGLVGALLRIPMRPPTFFLSPMRVVLGLMIGSAFTPALLGQFDRFVISLLFLAPFVIVLGLIGTPYYRRIAGFNFPTAFFSAMPGGLSEMTLLGSDVGADTRKLALVHSTRVLALLFGLPFLIEQLNDVDLGGQQSFAGPISDMNWSDLFVMSAWGLGGWLIAMKLRLSGASLVGPMLLSAAGHLTSLIHVQPPDEILQIAQWVLGTTIGCAFVGVTLKEIMGVMLQTLALLIILATITCAFALVVELAVGVSFVSALLAFSPGGQAEMGLIAIATGEDVAYVAVHHVARIFLVMVCAPMLFTFFRQRQVSS